MNDRDHLYCRPCDAETRHLPTHCDRHECQTCGQRRALPHPLTLAQSMRRDLVNRDHLCPRCDYHAVRRPGGALCDGAYSPSGAIILSSGQVECPDCDPYAESDCLPWTDDCDDCGGRGWIPCEHGGAA